MGFLDGIKYVLAGAYKTLVLMLVGRFAGEAIGDIVIWLGRS